MMVNGKKIAREMQEALKQKAANFLRAHGRSARLDIVYVGENPVIENFLRIKQKFGNEIGVETIVRRLSAEISQVNLVREIQKLAANENTDSMIVQLPLPHTLHAQEILDVLPPEKDIDVLSQKTFEQFASGESHFFPPVAGAVKEILEKHRISITPKILVLGEGRLVGKPVAAWLAREHADYSVANSKTQDLPKLLLDADIIISGIGVPGFIKPEMIKQGVAIVDAGTSEQGGKVAGDADPACAPKCSLFTPVPGGVGPITVAVLFQNLLRASDIKK